MEHLVVEILAVVVTSGAASGAVVFLTKSWISERLKGAISHEYNTKLASFKSQIKSENDTELERYKAKLAVQNSEHIERVRADLQIAHAKRDVEFRHLHAKIAEVIAEVYANLQALRHAVGQYTKELELLDDPPRQERAKAVDSTLVQFRDHFLPNQIYLTPALAQRIRDVYEQMFKTAQRFKLRVDSGSGSNIDEWVEISEWIQKELPQLFEVLEMEFRKLLGYDTHLAGAATPAHGASRAVQKGAEADESLAPSSVGPRS